MREIQWAQSVIHCEPRISSARSQKATRSELALPQCSITRGPPNHRSPRHPKDCNTSSQLQPAPLPKRESDEHARKKARWKTTHRNSINHNTMECEGRKPDPKVLEGLRDFDVTTDPFGRRVQVRLLAQLVFLQLLLALNTNTRNMDIQIQAKPKSQIG
jgi:hypothetical protein